MCSQICFSVGKAFRTTTVRKSGKPSLSSEPKALPTEKQIWLHTDIRAAKIEQIKNNPSVSWLFYDAKKRIQIRLKATAIIHLNDEISQIQWSKTPTKSRRSYITLAAPGSQHDEPTSGLDPAFEARDPTIEESEIGQPNFAVVITQIESLEWLFLHHSGHRRAFFQYNTEGVLLNSTWLIPWNFNELSLKFLVFIHLPYFWYNFER